MLASHIPPLFFHTFPASIFLRDCKPSNIGLNVRGDIQLFDFGLAKELKICDLVRNDRIVLPIFAVLALLRCTNSPS